MRTCKVNGNIGLNAICGRIAVGESGRCGADPNSCEHQSDYTALTLEQEAAALVGVEGWHPWIFERVVNGVLCTGAVCPLITRGKNKGEPNFRKYDKATKCSVVVPFKEVRKNA